jgi:multisubunit Na+/H+ antiporter MnhB subunit
MANDSSRLSGAAKWLLIFGLFLVANSAFLAAYGDPTFFYVANALLHPALGIGAAILLVMLFARHRDLLSGRLRKLAALLLALATVFGVYLLFVGMTRPHSLALYMREFERVAGLSLADWEA